MRNTLLSALVGFLLTAGCGETPEPATPKPPTKAEKKQAAAALPKGSVARERLEAVLRLGPARFFQKVELREEVVQNKFVGWRLLAIPSDWDDSGLVPGDVVTKVNGHLLEHPEEFTEAWNDVAEAKEIRIAYQRDGQARESVIPIVGQGGDPSAARIAIDAERPPEKRAQSNGIGRSTVIIGGDDDGYEAPAD